MNDTKSSNGWNLTLPLFQGVVFVDWHGVLSDHYFWSTPTESIPSDVFPCTAAVQNLFERSELIDRWMRGQIRSTEVIQHHLFDHPLADPAAALLHTHLVYECETSPLSDTAVRDALLHLKKRTHLVLATDNMDCFVDGIGMRSDLTDLFDDYISSSEVGVLKAEDPKRFFGAWMQSRDIDATNSILIDDSRSNCDAFESLGGRAVLYDSSTAHLKRKSEIAISNLILLLNE